MDDDAKVGAEIGAGFGRTASFVRNEILTRFENSYLAELEDAAVIGPERCSLAVSTDTYIVDPTFFPGGDIGRLAVCGTVNDLVASGSIPSYLTFSLVISERMPWKSLSRVLDSAAAAVSESKVRVVAGDTKVLPNTLAGPEICINTTGIGRLLHEDRCYALRETGPGHAIVVTGTLGDHSLAVLSAREGLGFHSRVISDCAPLHDLILPVLQQFDDIRALRDLTRGGLRTALHDLASSAEVDIALDLDALPVHREVQAGCEMLGLDPIDMVNEGKMMIVVDARSVDSLLARLLNHPLGHGAAVIGWTESKRSHRGVIRATGKDRPPIILQQIDGQPIPRLC